MSEKDKQKPELQSVICRIPECSGVFRLPSLVHADIAYLIIYIKRGFTSEQRLFLASPQLLEYHLIHQSLVLAEAFCLSLCCSMSSLILKIMMKLIMFACLQLDLMYAEGKFKQLSRI